MAIKMALGTELRHSLSLKHVSKFRLADHVGCGLTIPCLDGVSVMSFRLFFTVLWPLHNLLHSMIRRLRSHRSLGLMVHISLVFHDRAPNMEVPTTFAHNNGQVLGTSLERFFPSCGLQCTIPLVPVQVISPLNEQLVVPVLEWLHRARHKTLKRCQDASFARLLSLE